MVKVGLKSRSVESHSGARETLIAGPYHNLIPYAPRSNFGVKREETWGGVSPHHPTRGLDRLVERRKLPGGGPGWIPGRKWILCIFEVIKKPSGTPFSVFLSDGAAPRRCGARENFPPSPLSEEQAEPFHRWNQWRRRGRGRPILVISNGKGLEGAKLIFVILTSR